MERLQPIVSIVIPIYNGEKYIKQCLDSIVAQTFDDFEVIIVDDGSTDGSLSIARQYHEKDSRFFAYHTNNGGAGAARNHGMKYAKGEYLIFLDADDYFEPVFLEMLLNRIRQCDADICVCKCYDFDNVTSDEWVDECFREKYIPDEDVFSWRTNGRWLFNFCNGWPWDKLYRRSFITGSGLEFQELRSSNDTYFVLMTLALADSICVVKEPLIHHRVNNTHSVSATREISWASGIEAAKKVYNDMSRLGHFEEIRQSLYNCMIDYLEWHFFSISDNCKSKIYDKIRNEINPLYGFTNYGRGYYTPPETWDRMVEIVDYDYSDYLIKCDIKKLGDMFRENGLHCLSLINEQHLAVEECKREVMQIKEEEAKRNDEMLRMHDGLYNEMECCKNAVTELNKDVEWCKNAAIELRKDMEICNSNIGQCKDMLNVFNDRIGYLEELILQQCNERYEDGKRVVYSTFSYRIGHALVFIPGMVIRLFRKLTRR